MKIFSHIKVDVFGLNQNKLLQNLQNKNLKIISYKRISHTHSCFLISQKSFNSAQKDGFFEKFEVKIKPIKSLAYFLWSVPKRIGLVVGMVIVLLFCHFAKDYVFSISISGASAVQEHQIQEFLKSQNVEVGKKWSQISLRELENSIFVEVPTASNVVAKRQGSRLVISLGKSVPIRQTLGDIVAPADGKIESIEVSRGVAIKSKGDLVRAGEVIVKAGQSGKCSALICFRVYLQSSVAVRAHQTEFVRSGKSTTKIKFYCFWQKQQNPKESPYQLFEFEQTKSQVYQNFFLPFTKVTSTWFELVEKQVSEEEATNKAKQRALFLATQNLKDARLELESYDEHQENGQKFVDCFVEAVLHLG